VIADNNDSSAVNLGGNDAPPPSLLPLSLKTMYGGLALGFDGTTRDHFFVV